MNICHLTSVHSRHDIRILLKECGSLFKAGYKVDLVVADGELESEILHGINVHAVPKEAKGRFRRFTITVWHVYKKARDLNADVYHFHDPELQLIAPLLRMSGAKVIYDVHEDLPLQVLSKPWIKAFLRKPLSIAIKLFEKFMSIVFISKIVAATPPIAKNFPKKKTITVQNFPILDEFINIDISDYLFREKQAVYIGGLAKIRGIKEVVRALSSLSQGYNLSLAGDFKNDGLREELNKIEYWDKVDFLGWQSREGISNLLAKSRLGLVLLHPRPNYLESFPIKLFEYMAAGIPVIASNFPLWKEIIEDANCGIAVDPFNIDEIKQAIEWIMVNQEEAKKMGENGRKAVLAKYNWDTEKNKLIALYKSLG